jgi:hypothetical protein
MSKCNLRELVVPRVGSLNMRELVLPRVGSLKKQGRLCFLGLVP